ncbi:putative spore protein YtfJ [Oxobacter pfennigii]|uniref:Putative spore protein YtfJ n=1 Tax=Oxobacter pfennigii TaxID=36849 RepID=A0A0P8YCI5_9CLOT|nr:GerW family sporulation protein [Oxobacter pfennigii]KPU44870.1 putative spore protein YtfJ [Oxobacter pfennigii]
MNDHPIQGLMKTTMDSIKDMIDVNTIVGDAVESPDGSVIIPISRVAFGFAAGGGEYEMGHKGDDGEEESNKHPFGGGSGAGVSVQPVAFLVVGNNQTKLLPVNYNNVVDRIVDLMPNVIDNIEKVAQNMRKPHENNVHTGHSENTESPLQ